MEKENNKKNKQEKELTEEQIHRKKVRTFNTVLYTVAAILILTGVIILVREFLYVPDDETDGLVSESDVYAVKETFKPLATPVADYDIVPVKFHFIDRGASCDIYPVGVDDEGGMATIESAKDVSWLSVDPYVVPGDKGNAVIAGHNLWKNEAGTFSLLKKVRKGEVVAVTFDAGFTRYFEVVKILDTKYNDNSPMETEGVDEPILTLITCKGNWSSTLGQSKNRIVVICKPIEHDK